MNKKGLFEVINALVLKNGFKRNGMKWVLANEEIEKVISLQASSYSKKFYLNFGIILLGLELDGLEYHVFEGFGTIINYSESEKIDIFDLENNLSDEARSVQIVKVVNGLLLNLKGINSRDDLIKYLKGKTNLNFIPLITKAHLGVT